MTSRAASCALALLLLLCGAAAPAMAGADRNACVEPHIAAIDQVRADLDAMQKSLEATLRDQTDGRYPEGGSTLRDLIYVCDTERLELHNLVEVYVLSNVDAAGKAFRKAKLDELLAKTDDALDDLGRRRAYVALNQASAKDGALADGIAAALPRITALLDRAADALTAMRAELARTLDAAAKQ
mgnify:CR=1 FL=1